MQYIFGINAMYIAAAVLAVCYVILFMEKMNRAVIAMVGAAIMVLLGILDLQSALAGIDFNTIALLVGMMTMVGICEKSGMFQFVAIWAAKRVNANPQGLLVVLALVTAVFSAFLDNVTTVLLIVPITFQITKKLKVTPYPYLVLEIFASNIGGTATLIGDPPNILIGSALNLSFMDFLSELTGIISFIMVFLILVFDCIWGRHLKTTDTNRRKVRAIRETDCITDWGLMYKSLGVLLATIFSFIMAEHWHIANGTIALFGAAVLLALYATDKEHMARDNKVDKAFAFVDWVTIFFFIGLFVIVHGLEVTGALKILGAEFVKLTDGSILKATMLVAWVSALVSTAIDNIPFVATMIPVLKSMEPDMGGREAMMPVWWALSLGACLGGNGSLIAASANVIVAGMAAREGEKISFMGFFKWALPTMIVSVGIATAYLYIRHFM